MKRIFQTNGGALTNGLKAFVAQRVSVAVDRPNGAVYDRLALSLDHKCFRKGSEKETSQVSHTSLIREVRLSSRSRSASVNR